MSNVQPPGSKTFDSHILMHSCTHKNDVSLTKQFQKHLYKEIRKYGLIDQGKYRKRASKRKWTYRAYHVQDNAYFAHKDVKIYFDTNQFPALTIFGSHQNPHVARGLSNHYHLRFYQKIGHGICAIFRIPCAFFGCTSMPDKPWISGINSKKHSRYQPVTNCTYWPILGSYDNWDIIEITPK